MSKLEFTRGDQVAGKYEIADLLEEGPLGVTYRCKNLKSGGNVRLRFLRPDVITRDRKDEIISAFKKAKAIEHSNLIKVGELGEHQGTAFYTMEDFDGSSLRRLIRENKIAGRNFTLQESASIIIQILEALEAAHAQGVTLRALRPEGVLVHAKRTGPRGVNLVATVKVVGIGMTDLLPTGVLAEDEFTRGDSSYLAPELKGFEPEATPSCDIYSATVLFYEMLTGTAPTGTFQLPSTFRNDLPSHVNDIVELGLANAPEDRYQTTRDFINDIQRAFTDTTFDEPESKGNTMRTLMLGGVLGAAILALVAVVLFGRSSDPFQEALNADNKMRTEVMDSNDRPTEDEIKAIMSQHEGMVYIPGGTFVHGRLNHEFDASKSEDLAEVVQVEGFLIDRFEAPNQKGAPVTNKVTFADAEAACAEQGKRLCSDLEWEKACKGTSNFVYSYGDSFDPDFCGNGLDDKGYSPGDKANCKSRYGVYDLSGNFREWTSTAYRDNNRRLIKGGLRGNAERGTRCAFSTDESVGYTDETISYRCCRDLGAPPTPAPAEGAEEAATE